MKGLGDFARELTIATESKIPEVVSAELAKFARAELAEAIRTGEGSSSYVRYVNQREGLAEEAVAVPGSILYEFQWWDAVIEFALTELVKRSPKRSGKYSRSFLVIASGRVVTSYEQLTARSEIIIL